VTARERRLEAPHRRLEPGSRLAERTAIVAYRVGTWIVGRVPPAIPRFLIARASQLAYLVWPTKRRWSNANFAHVLGLPPDHPRVRRTALAAYAEYARYVVEVMRLPQMSRDEATRLIVSEDLDRVEPIWRDAKGGLILAVGHIGNGEAAAAGVASRGWPMNVIADDSAYPELFEDFRKTREHWGVHVIPWRSLREIYTVLRNREFLGFFVDWGYRRDGIPVRLFDAWTTLPAGPVALAAKTGSRILPVAIRRLPSGSFSIVLSDPIDVESMDPAAQLAATQRLADAIQASIAAAPNQWYSFKPIWPEDPGESAELERRAAAMAAGLPDPGPEAGRALQGTPAAPEADPA